MNNPSGNEDTLRCPNTLTACPSPHVCDQHCHSGAHYCRDCEMKFLAKPTVATFRAMLDAIDAPCEHRASKRCTACLADRAIAFVEGPAYDMAAEIERLRAENASLRKIISDTSDALIDEGGDIE